jgi:hypothetical protein
MSAFSIVYVSTADEQALWAAGVVREAVLEIPGAKRLEIAKRIHQTVSEDVLAFQNDIGNTVSFRCDDWRT